MNKKFMTMLLVIVMVVGMVPMAVGAECAHTDKTILASQDATCGADGYIVYQCNDASCKTTWTDVIPASGNHNMYNGTCLNCGTWCTNHDVAVYETVAPTCKDDGYTRAVCAACGEGKVATGAPATGVHTYVNGVCTGCNGNCLHGDFTEVFVATTCEADGYKHHVCNVCGNVDVIWEQEAIGHEYDENGDCLYCDAIQGENPEDPKPEDPKPEDPKPEDPKPEDPKPEDPKPEEPKPEEPKVEEPKVEEPKVEASVQLPTYAAVSTVGLDNVPKTGCAFVEWLYALIFS